MNLSRLDTTLLSIVAASLAGGQYFFRRAGGEIRGLQLNEAASTLIVYPGFYIALALYGCATILWIFVLSRVPLMLAYPWIAAATIAVPFIGKIAFGERVGPMFWPGFGLIVVGLCMTQIGTRG